LGEVLQRIHLKFLQFHAIIETDWEELLLVLEKDFWSFKSTDSYLETFNLKIIKDSTRPEFPAVKSSSQTQNAITYDIGKVRYCDYYGEAFTSINFETEQAILNSNNFHKAHEVAYLLILSRIGKKLDLAGYHKLHAFAVLLNNKALVCMMPSKGGKSTLLIELLKNPKVKMLSDDIPLVARNGNIFSFPLKLGLNDIPENFDVADPEFNIYEMKRSLYGTKKLVCTKGLGARVEKMGSSYSKIILMSAQRFNSSDCKISDENWLNSFKELFKHGIIGLGTPMIIEYFWESGIADFFAKTKIFFSRLIAFYSLSIKSKRINLALGNDPALAAKKIINYLETLN
jgi:hypothetical protein